MQTRRKARLIIPAVEEAPEPTCPLVDAVIESAGPRSLDEFVSWEGETAETVEEAMEMLRDANVRLRGAIEELAELYEETLRELEDLRDEQA